ncbi:unnamed protein product [Peniophora sp. CBMAI 1063]|nr:unnamed protein product [Peniophora sp. CBMAI 1063]
MASGFGYTSGRPRCFVYWQEFSKCYASNDTPSQCNVQAEDYLECLHHTKEIARAKTVQAEFARKAMHHAEEGRKASDILADGVVLGVGLIDRGGDKH